MAKQIPSAASKERHRAGDLLGVMLMSSGSYLPKLPQARVYKLIRNCRNPLPAHRVGERTIRVQRDELQAGLDDRKIVSREDA